MQNDKQLDSRSFSVPRYIQDKTRRATIAQTIGQIAHADLMVKHYRNLAMMEPDKEKRGKYALKAEQLEDGREMNIAFLKYCKYQPGDEREPFLSKLRSLFS